MGDRGERAGLAESTGGADGAKQVEAVTDAEDDCGVWAGSGETGADRAEHGARPSGVGVDHSSEKVTRYRA